MSAALFCHLSFKHNLKQVLSDTDENVIKDVYNIKIIRFNIFQINTAGAEYCITLL